MHNTKEKDLEKVALGIALMFGVYWLYAYFLQDKWKLPARVETVLGLLSLYGVGLSLFMLLINGVPSGMYKRNKISAKQLVLCFLLQFSAIMIMSVFANVVGVLGLEFATVEIDAVSPFMLFLLLVFNPIAEEFVFRKLFADKLLRYGERFYMLTSSFCFAIVHGVSLGIPQVIYTFILGLIWSYVMVKSGDLRLVILLHALSNLFGAVLLQLLLNIAMPLAGIYSVLLMVIGAVGLSIFMAKRKNVVLDDSSGLFRSNVLKCIFTNKGIGFYVLLTVFMMLVK